MHRVVTSAKFVHLPADFDLHRLRRVGKGHCRIQEAVVGACRNVAAFAATNCFFESRQHGFAVAPGVRRLRGGRRALTAARQIQIKRYAALGLPHVSANAAAPGSIIEEAARSDPVGLSLLREASERLNLSARGFYRVLKLARTIADLEGAATVGRAHLAEALSYRINGGQELRAA